MRWPIRNQILIPFASILLIAVATIAASSAVVAARRTERDALREINQVIRTLQESNFPFSVNVLSKMQGLSGSEFLVYDAKGHLVGSTLEGKDQLDFDPTLPRKTGELESLEETSSLLWNGRSFLVASLNHRGPTGRATTLFVLYPEEKLVQARREAIWPPLIVGGVTFLTLIVISLWVANRMSRRIRRVQQQVAAIAGGDFRQIPLSNRYDEIHELVRSVNEMASQLSQMQNTIQRTERSQLLGQVAGGLAHQLRNAVTGARMAVQIHQRRCSTEESDESLSVALKQLALTEEQIKRLLSIGRREGARQVPADFRSLLEETLTLINPACKHAHVDLSFAYQGRDCTILDSEAVKAAVLNLLLNAVDAAGIPGKVALMANVSPERIQIEVHDTGSGPPPELAHTLFDAFVTSKPEGVGLGLALVKQVAEESGGSLSWSRQDDQTVFQLILLEGFTFMENSSPTAPASSARVE